MRLRTEMKDLSNRNFRRLWQVVNKKACHREAEAIWVAIRGFGKRYFYG